MKSTTHFIINCVLLVLMLCSLSQYTDAQNVNATQNPPVYDGGQIQYAVSNSSSGNYSIETSDKSPEQTLVNSTYNNGQITYAVDTPGVYFARLANGTFGSAVYKPFEIKTTSTEPSDFDAYWSGVVNDLPDLNAQLSVQAQGNLMVGDLILDNINGKKIYCKIAYPANGNNMAGILSIKAFSGDKNIASTDHITGLANQHNVIAVSIAGVSEIPVGQTANPKVLEGEKPFLEHRNGYYYKNSIAACYQVLNYIASRPDYTTSKGIALTGVSQGAGLSLLLGGVDAKNANRVKCLLVTQPILCDNSGILFKKASGYPNYILRTPFLNSSSVAAAAAYYDVTHAAKRINDPVYMGIGYRDTTTQPAGNFAAFNELRVPVHLAHGVNIDHDHNINGFWTGALSKMFFEKYLNGNNATATGSTVYFVDAGADKTIAQSGTVSLTGTIDAMNAPTPSLVEWSCIDCPAIPDFDTESITTNGNAYTINATFPMNGEYKLRFGPVSSTDNAARKLYINSSNDSNLYHTAMDYMVVTVGDNPTTLSFNSCPNDITVQAPTGANSATVNWNTPTASTTCNGNVAVTQTAGGSNGSNFNIGTSTVTYQATDNCSNSATCSFTVTVTSAPGGSFSLNCPTNITVTAAQGANGATVPWTEPTATTDCNTGGGCSGNAISDFTYIGEHDGSDYYVSQLPQKWIDAKVTCESKDGQLVTITSQEENNFIFNNISTAVLIGISDEDKDGSLQWVTGESISYTNWNSINNQLNSNSGNLYGMLNYWTSDGKWEIANYWTSKPFIMEVPCSGGGGGNSTPTITQTQGPANGSFFSVGTTTVGYTASDNCNNTDNCTFTVTVLENPLSELTLNCPGDLTFTAPSGANGMNVNWSEPTASTSCGGNAMVTQLSALTNGSFLQIGTYILSYEATDNCDNTKNCVFMLTVEEGDIGSCNISLPNTCTADLVCVNLSGNELSVNTNDNTFPVIAIHNADYTVRESLCDFWPGDKPTCTGILSSSSLPGGDYLLKVPETSGGNCWIPFSVGSAPRLTGEDTRLMIYPNPVKDNLHIILPESITTSQSDSGQFIITNTLGQQVQTLPVSGEQVHTLDVSGFAKGIYFIQLQSKDYKIQATKFIVD